MAAKTVTLGVGSLIYIDKNSTPHTVTTDQTFDITLTDGGTTAVKYSVDTGQSVTTTDGYTLYFRPETETVTGNGCAPFFIGYMSDATEDSDDYGIGGELVIECPVSGIKQRWVFATIDVDDYDSPSTLSGTLEDQFGNKMTITGATLA